MCKFKEEEFVLKNGKKCIIREIRVDDAKETIEYLKTVMGESEYLLRYPEEVTFTIEGEKKILDGFVKSNRDIMIVA